jgi:hypothetical protein
MVREVAVIEKLIFEEVADAYVESAAIDALTVHVPGATNVTTPDAEPTVQTTAGEPEYVLAPAPAEAVLVSVGGEADIAYVEVYEPESIAMVREFAVIAKLISEEVAQSYVESAWIDELIVHVPAATKVTAPEFSTVHTGLVALVKLFAPPPADAVLVNVGGVADKAYVDVYEPESILNVREINSGAIVVVVVVVDVVVVVATTSVMENLAVDDVAGYTPSLAIDAVT